MTALVLAVPTGLLLPERARGAFVVMVPLAGAIAAAAWVALVQPWRYRPADGTCLLIPFALGCVAGVAFRATRRPRASIDPADGKGRSLPASTALSCEP